MGHTHYNEPEVHEGVVYFYLCVISLLKINREMQKAMAYRAVDIHA